MISFKALVNFSRRPLRKQFFGTSCQLLKVEEKHARPLKMPDQKMDSIVEPKFRADPKNGYAFKRLFGRKQNVLIELLNDVLALEYPIKEVEHIDIGTIPVVKDHKATKLDLICTLADDTSMIVGVQVFRENYYNDRRATYYGSMLCLSRYKDGYFRDDVVMKPLSVVTICDTIMFDNKEYLSDHRLMDLQSGVEWTPQMRYVYLELPKYTSKELENPSDFWALFFAHMYRMEPNEIDELNLSVKKPIIVEALQSLDYYNWTADEQKCYNQEEVNQVDIMKAVDLQLAEDTEELTRPKKKTE